MAIGTVKNKYQVVIPQHLRKQIGINVGDLMEAKVEHGKITFVPKVLIDSRIAESLAVLTGSLTLPIRQLLFLKIWQKSGKREKNKK